MPPSANTWMVPDNRPVYGGDYGDFLTPEERQDIRKAHQERQDNRRDHQESRQKWRKTAREFRQSQIQTINKDIDKIQSNLAYVNKVIEDPTLSVYELKRALINLQSSLGQLQGEIDYLLDMTHMYRQQGRTRVNDH